MSKLTSIQNLESNELNALLHSITAAIDLSEKEKNIGLQNLCDNLLIVNSEIEKIDNDYKEKNFNEKSRFNVFSCLTRHHLEELHSKFLKYLLDPKETHECNDLFLRLFFETLIEDDEIKNEIAEINPDFLKAEVIREKHIGFSAKTKTYGFIDIFIGTDKINIVIENKIRAGEQDKQIFRYINYCKHLRKKYIALYLTPRGIISEEAGKELYFPISYNKTINAWLDKCINHVSEFPFVQSGICYYKNLLNDIILNNPSNLVVMEINKILLKPENALILKYWKELSAAFQETHDFLRTDFFSKVLLELNNRYEFIPVNGELNQIQSSQIWDENYNGLMLNNPECKLFISDNKYLAFVIQHEEYSGETDLYYGITCYKILNNGNKSTSLHRLTIIKEVDAIMNKKNNFLLEPVEENWCSFKYFRSVKKDITFGDSDLDYYFATNMDKIVKQFVSEVDQLILTWKETIKEISKRKNKK